MKNTNPILPILMCLGILLYFTTDIAGQIAVNTTGLAADNSAMLDVSSDTKGVLIPRMTKADRDAISNPAMGLMIYQTDNTPGYYYYNSSSWGLIGDGGATTINGLSDGKTGGNSVFLGTNAGANDDGTDNENVGIGIDALSANTSGRRNSAIGYRSLYSNTNGWGNTALGDQALRDNNSGLNNIAVGCYALDKSTTGSYNIAIGFSAMDRSETPYKNIAIGYYALRYNINGGSNVGIGYETLYNNKGDNNVGLGQRTNYYNQTGSNNTMIGHEAGMGGFSHSKSGNVFLGYQAGFSEHGSNKLYIENSLSNSPLIYGEFDNNLVRINGDLDVTGIFSGMAINDLSDGKTGGGSVFLGSGAGTHDDGTDNNNVGVGWGANFQNQEGSNNTIIGYEAGRGVANHNKSGNIFIGYQAGYSETGDNNLYIENSNSIAPLIYGNFTGDFITIHGNLGVGTKLFGNGTHTLSLVDGTTPNASITDGVLLYSENVSGSELRVRDEAGNITTLSPHNFSITTKSEPMAWSYYSENAATGQVINVDMLKTVRTIEKFTGEKLVFIKNSVEDTHEIAEEEKTMGIIQQQQQEIDTLKKLNTELIKRIEKLENNNYSKR